MDDIPDLSRLPVALAAALRLRRAGADDILIGQALDVDPEGVQTLIELAEAKLRRLTTSREVGSPQPDPQPDPQPEEFLS